MLGHVDVEKGQSWGSIVVRVEGAGTSEARMALYVQLIITLAQGNVFDDGVGKFGVGDRSREP